MTWVRLFVARRISLELVHFIMGGSQEYAGRVSVEGVIQAPSSALSQEVEFDLTADEAAEYAPSWTGWARGRCGS